MGAKLEGERGRRIRDEGEKERKGKNGGRERAWRRSWREREVVKIAFSWKFWRLKNGS